MLVISQKSDYIYMYLFLFFFYWLEVNMDLHLHDNAKQYGVRIVFLIAIPICKSNCNNVVFSLLAVYFRFLVFSFMRNHTILCVYTLHLLKRLICIHVQAVSSGSQQQVFSVLVV